MLILSILLLLISNAVTVRRDKSILYSRVTIEILICCFLISINSFHLHFYDIEMKILGGIFLATVGTPIAGTFHIFVFVNRIYKNLLQIFKINYSGLHCSFIELIYSVNKFLVTSNKTRTFILLLTSFLFLCFIHFLVLIGVFNIVHILFLFIVSGFGKLCLKYENLGFKHNFPVAHDNFSFVCDVIFIATTIWLVIYIICNVIKTIYITKMETGSSGNSGGSGNSNPNQGKTNSGPTEGGPNPGGNSDPLNNSNLQEEFNRIRREAIERKRQKKREAPSRRKKYSTEKQRQKKADASTARARAAREEWEAAHPEIVAMQESARDDYMKIKEKTIEQLNKEIEDIKKEIDPDNSWLDEFEKEVNKKDNKD